MIQIILGVIICLIGLFVFYKYPIKSDVRQITMGALFVILAIILKRLAIMVPFLGFPSLKITLEVLPLILAGLVLQPGYAFIVSLSVDWLGLLLASSGGFPFLGFTLNAVLQTQIPAVLKQVLKHEDKVLEKIVKIIMLVISLLAIIYIFMMNEVNISGTIYKITLMIKVIILVIVLILLGILFVFMNKYSDKMFYYSILSVVFIELVVTFFLTPMWLEIMYGIPFFASQFVRVLKSCIIIPLNTTIVYAMNCIISKVIK